MALINCSECQKQVSDKAAACPHCGAPLAAPTPPPVEVTKLPEPTQAIVAPAKRKTGLFTLFVLTVILLFVAWWLPKAHRESNLPPMPIAVQTRTALTGPGLVLAVRNTSDSYLTFLVTLKNPTTTEEKSFRLDGPPGGVVEIGHKEGWALASGDNIKVTNNAYQNWQGVVP